jgi:twinkle protein
MNTQTTHDAFLGYYEPAGLDADLLRLYDSGGLPRGDSTGWEGLDDYFTVVGGQWTLVTGIPGMGKSEFLDALAVNLAEGSGWTFGILSPENFPVVSHVVKLIEKRCRKPFNAGPTPRIERDDLTAAKTWVHAHFRWIRPRSESPIEAIAHALAYVRKPKRKLGVILDPWNMLDHADSEWRDHQTNETEYVGRVLTALTRLLRADENSNVHVWIVAHPAKLYRDKSDGKLPVPSGYDVAGSAHWFNRADNILCVHRDKLSDTQDVDVFVQKVRFKNVGRVGVATLKYDRITGRYFEFKGAPIIDIATGKPERYTDPAARYPCIDDAEARAEREAIQMEGQP